MTPPGPTACAVFLLTHEFHPKRGGITTFCEELATAAAARGHPVEVWAPRRNVQQEPAWPFTVRRLPLAGSHDPACRLRLAVELLRERRRLRHAIVHLAEPGPMLAYMLLQPWRALHPRRLILTFHGSEILRFQADPVTRLLTRRLIRRAYRISTLTRYTQQLLCQHFPEAATKVFRTPGGLRTSFHTALPSPAPAPRDPAAPVVVLTVGRIHPRKGQVLTLEALQRLPPALRRRIEYWIVGTASRAPHQQSLAAAAARADFPVRMLGDVADAQLSDIYARADIFALTSIDHRHSVEGFGLVYLEASAHGLPVIAHAVGGVSEAVADNETGLLIDPRQPTLLTAAFARLIEDPALRARLGQAGPAWARTHSWSRAAELLYGPGEVDPASHHPSLTPDHTGAPAPAHDPAS